MFQIFAMNWKSQMAKSYCLLALLCSLVLSAPLVAFVASPSHNRTPNVHKAEPNDGCISQKGAQTRRPVLSKIISTAGLLSSASIASFNPQPSHATVMSR